MINCPAVCHILPQSCAQERILTPCINDIFVHTCRANYVVDVFFPTIASFKMSAADDSSGHLHGSHGQSENPVEHDTLTEATLSKLVTIQHQSLGVAPGKIDSSRKHEVIHESSVHNLKAQPDQHLFRALVDEESTPHASVDEESILHKITQPASDGGFSSPLKLQVQQLANTTIENKKFEELYISEKQKREESEREVEKLRNVVYKLDKFGKLAVLTTDEESLVRSVRAKQGIDNFYISCFPSDLFTLFNSPLQL